MTTKRKLPSEYLRQGWCQGAHARGESKRPVKPRSPLAVQWCIEGAALQVFGSFEALDFKKFLNHVVNITIRTDPWAWSDAPERTQTEVVAVAEEAERRMGLRDA